MDSRKTKSHGAKQPCAREAIYEADSLEYARLAALLVANCPHGDDSLVNSMLIQFPNRISLTEF